MTSDCGKGVDLRGQVAPRSRFFVAPLLRMTFIGAVSGTIPTPVSLPQGEEDLIALGSPVPQRRGMFRLKSRADRQTPQAGSRVWRDSASAAMRSQVYSIGTRSTSAQIAVWSE